MKLCLSGVIDPLLFEGNYVVLAMLPSKTFNVPISISWLNELCGVKLPFLNIDSRSFETSFFNYFYELIFSRSYFSKVFLLLLPLLKLGDYLWF